MTLKELSKLYNLKREIELNERQLVVLRKEIQECKDTLDRLRSDIGTGGIGSPAITDMPKGPSRPGSQIENMVIRLMGVEDALTRKQAAYANIEAIISARQTLVILERTRLETYIDSIEDSYLRQVFTWRFVNGLTWDGVAHEMGGSNKGESVKKMCYRYIRTH